MLDVGVRLFRHNHLTDQVLRELTISTQDLYASVMPDSKYKVRSLQSVVSCRVSAVIYSTSVIASQTIIFDVIAVPV